MKASAKRIILKNKAKNVLSGRYYGAISILVFWALLYLLLEQFDVSLTSSFYESPLTATNATLLTILSYAVPLLFSVLAEILQAGLCLFHLNLSTNNPAYAFDLLYGYFHQFQKFFCISGVKSVLAFVCTLPLNFIIDFRNTAGFWQSSTFLCLVLLQLLGFAVFFPISLALSQAYFLAFDYPALSFSEILKQSAKIMKGRKLQLFAIQLSFLPLFLLGLFSFGLGLFWVLPYYNVTLTLYYLDVMRPDQN